MYDFIKEPSDAEEADYCPRCGAEIKCGLKDDPCQCDKCGRRFGVIVTEDRNDNKNDSEA